MQAVSRAKIFQGRFGVASGSGRGRSVDLPTGKVPMAMPRGVTGRLMRRDARRGSARSAIKRAHPVQESSGHGEQSGPYPQRVGIPSGESPVARTNPFEAHRLCELRSRFLTRLCHRPALGEVALLPSARALRSRCCASCGHRASRADPGKLEDHAAGGGRASSQGALVLPELPNSVAHWTHLMPGGKAERRNGCLDRIAQTTAHGGA